jgi:hypothetical protein
MADRPLHTLLSDGAFFESPRWHDGRWWVSDFYRHLVLTVDTDGRAKDVMTVEQQPSGLGWMPDGSLLVVSMKDHRLLRRLPGGKVAEHADLTEFCGGHLNDMVVDADGRAYVGNFGFDLMGGADPAPAALVRVDSDGSATLAAEELLFPNGSVITADGQTLIVGETAGARYTAFTISSDGALSDRRVWAQVAPTPELGPLEETLPQLKFGPDGCARRRGAHLGRRRSRRPLLPRGRRRRDRRGDSRARRARDLRLHAWRRGRAYAPALHGPRFRGGQPQPGTRGGALHDRGRRSPRRPALTSRLALI